MKKERKLFCEYGPVCYKISVLKEGFKKDIQDSLQGKRFAKGKSTEVLPEIWKSNINLLLRELHGVDMSLQRNKVVNLTIASKKIDGIIINPGEEFSFWNTVGSISAKKGYLEGLVIASSSTTKGIGGGMCQLANMIHWLVLHTPMQVTELHHHTDALFPDSKRRVPFGTGTSISYKAYDYRFKNTTDTPVQLKLWLDDTYLYGEIRSTEPLVNKYKIEEEDHHFAADEQGVFYRNSRVYKVTSDKKSGEVLSRELILKNHSRVMYDYDLIPKEQIRC